MKGGNSGLSKDLKNGDIGLWRKPHPCGLNPLKKVP